LKHLGRCARADERDRKRAAALLRLSADRAVFRLAAEWARGPMRRIAAASMAQNHEEPHIE